MAKSKTWHRHLRLDRPIEVSVLRGVLTGMMSARYRGPEDLSEKPWGWMAAVDVLRSLPGDRDIIKLRGTQDNVDIEHEFATELGAALNEIHYEVMIDDRVDE